MPEVNWFAVIVAALATFGVGGLWYSPPAFAKIWQREAGLSDDDLKRGSPGVIFGLSFVLALVTSAVFAMFLGPQPAFGFAIAAGFAAGLCWVSTSLGITYLFERRSLRLFLIDAGYHVVQFTVIGAILGAWH